LHKWAALSPLLDYIPALPYGSAYSPLPWLCLSTFGAYTSSVLSLLLEMPNQMSGGEVRLLPTLPHLGLPPLRGRWMAVCHARMCSIGVALSSKGGRCLRQHSSQVVLPSTLSPRPVGRVLPSRWRVAHRVRVAATSGADTPRLLWNLQTRCSVVA
jgi:hypothetical protein